MYAIWDAWTARFGSYERSGGDPVFPPPRAWDLTPLSQVAGEAEEIEAELTMKLLAAFRCCVPPGERLVGHRALAARVVRARPSRRDHGRCATEWARPILPDGDSHHYIAKDWSSALGGRGKLTVFGEPGGPGVVAREFLRSVARDRRPEPNNAMQRTRCGGPLILVVRRLRMRRPRRRRKATVPHPRRRRPPVVRPLAVASGAAC